MCPYSQWLPNDSANVNCFFINCNRLPLCYLNRLYPIEMRVAAYLSLHMMTSSNGTFSPLLALCEGNSPGTGEFPSQGPVTRSFDVFLHLKKRLSKQSRLFFRRHRDSLWRHYNVKGSTNLATIALDNGFQLVRGQGYIKTDIDFSLTRQNNKLCPG